MVPVVRPPFLDSAFIYPGLLMFLFGHPAWMITVSKRRNSPQLLTSLRPRYGKSRDLPPL